LAIKMDFGREDVSAGSSPAELLSIVTLVSERASSRKGWRVLRERSRNLEIDSAFYERQSAPMKRRSVDFHSP